MMRAIVALQRSWRKRTELANEEGTSSQYVLDANRPAQQPMAAHLQSPCRCPIDAALLLPAGFMAPPAAFDVDGSAAVLGKPPGIEENRGLGRGESRQH